MKSQLSVLLLALGMVSVNAEASKTESVSTTQTFLRYLDLTTIKCGQGLANNGANYPTPSVIEVSSSALSLPTQNVKSYFTFSKTLGLPCEDMKAEFLKNVNEHGTAPVNVTRELRKSYSSEAWVQTNEKGENVHATYVCQEVFSEWVSFNIGEFDFLGTAEFKTGIVPMDKCSHR